MNFFYYSTLGTKIIYMISLLVVFLYLGIKLKKRKYVFSIFNYGIYISIFSYYVIGIFQYDNIAWKALGKKSASEFYYFLDKNLQINLIGVSFLFVFLIFYEFKRKNIVKNKLEILVERKINLKVIKIVNVMLLILWFLLVFSNLGFSLPIFNNNRGFLKFSYLQSIYNILNGYIQTITIIMVLFIKKKNIITKLLLVMNIMILLGTGNRSPVFSIFLMYFIYLMKDKKINLRNLFKYFLIGVFLLVGIMYIDKIRGGSLENIFYKIKYGNTFSDIRDGAFILYGMERLNITYLYGKMYLADLLAFIPSEFLKYRENFAYSNFTTKYLFGWQGHYGLRGGIFITPYINFGYIGVICGSYILARILSKIENYYYNNRITYKNFYYFLIQHSFSMSLLLTAGFMKFYILLGQIVTLIILNMLIIKKKGRVKNEK